MKRFSKIKERGAASGYTISVIVLAVLLIGGVLLLKNIGGKPEVDKPIAVETGDFKADDTKDKTEDKTETTPVKDDNKDKQPETTATGNMAATGYTPENLVASGPEDFVVAMVGMMLAGATIYAAREYVKSRSVVKSTLLRK